jgi:hypothetical protein
MSLLLPKLTVLQLNSPTLNVLHDWGRKHDYICRTQTLWTHCALRNKNEPWCVQFHCCIQYKSLSGMMKYQKEYNNWILLSWKYALLRYKQQWTGLQITVKGFKGPFGPLTLQILLAHTTSLGPTIVKINFNMNYKFSLIRNIRF